MAPPRRTKPESPPDMFQQPAGQPPPPDTAAPAAAPPAVAKPKCQHVNGHLGRCTIDADVPHEKHIAANGDGWFERHEQAPPPVQAAPAAPIAAPQAAAPPPQAASAPPPAAAPARQPAPAAAPAVKPRIALPGMRKAEAKPKPYRMFLFGEPGIGKSTFGVQAESPIFIPAETSPNVPDDMCFEQPSTWNAIFTVITTLGNEAHEYKTLVLDTADAATALCTSTVLEKAQQGAGTRGKAVYLTDVGGGFNNAGGSALDEEWVKLLSWLDRLSAVRGMNIIILGHSKIGKFRSPEAGVADFDMWVPRVPEAVANRLIGWADIVALAKRDIRTGREGKKGRDKALAVGASHTLYTRAIPVAPSLKNRYELPDSMPLDYETFAGYMRAKRSPAEMEAMRNAIIEKGQRLAGHTFLDRSGQPCEYGAWLAQRLQKNLTVADMLQIDSKLSAKIDELFPPETQGDGEPGDGGQAA